MWSVIISWDIKNAIYVVLIRMTKAKNATQQALQAKALLTGPSWTNTFASSTTAINGTTEAWRIWSVKYRLQSSGSGHVLLIPLSSLKKGVLVFYPFWYHYLWYSSFLVLYNAKMNYMQYRIAVLLYKVCSCIFLSTKKPRRVVANNGRMWGMAGQFAVFLLCRLYKTRWSSIRTSKMA
jgi:hypothetical protein